MILGMGVPELLVILFIALLIFGPKNLPKLGKSLGETVKSVREGMEGDGEPKQVAEAAAPAAASAAEPVEATAPAADEVVVEEDVVFCSKCGAKNKADDAFCSKCGAKLSE